MTKALCNLMSCEEVLEDSDPLEAFSSKGLLNFNSHYCNNQHDSLWCKFHAATNKDGNPYTTKSPLLTTVVGGNIRRPICLPWYFSAKPWKPSSALLLPCQQR